MGISGKGVTTSMNIIIRRRLNNKQKGRTTNSDIFPQYFMKVIESFKDLTHLCQRKKWVKSEPTESYIS